MGQVFLPLNFGVRISAAVAVLSIWLICAQNALAEDSNWYVGANVPIMYIDDTDTITTGSSANPQALMAPQIPYRAKAVNKYDTGYKLEGVIGYELGSNFRVELELFYAEADVDKLTYSGISTTTQQGPLAIDGKTSVPVSGTTEQTGAMLNLWYDFHLGSKWIPYLGVGIGYIEVDFGDVKYDENALAQHVTNRLVQAQAYATAQAQNMPFDPAQIPVVTLPPGYVPEISRTDSVVAYQAAAGISYQFRDNVVFRLGYRYQTSEDLKFDGGNATGTIDTKTEFDVQFIEIGFRYHF